MSFILRIAIVILLLLVIEYFFLRTAGSSLKKVFPSLNRKYYRVIRTVLIIALNLYPVSLLVYVISGTSGKFPENNFIDYLLIYPYWTFVFVCVQSLLFIILLKLVKLLLWPFINKEKIAALEQKLILGILVFSLIYIPVRSVYDYYNVEVRHVTYAKQGLSEALKNFKLVFISDTQADRYTDSKRLSNYIELVNSQNPDLVLIGGDVITSGPEYIDSAAKYLGQIKSKYGVFTCRGDHDHWAYREDINKSIKLVTNALAKLNVQMINNENIELKINNADVEITFITNTYPRRISQDELDTLIVKDRKDLKILVTHQPGKDIMNLSSNRNYDLFLAGHTHGGQITFLFPFYNLSPTLFETRYVRGDFYIGNMLMIITRGLGMSLVPMRINSTPEITVITFWDK